MNINFTVSGILARSSLIERGGESMKNLSLAIATCLALWGVGVSVACAAEAAPNFTFAGEYRAVNPESGEVAASTTLRIIPYQKGMEQGDGESNPALALRAWVVEVEETNEKIYLDRLSDKDREMSDSLKSRGWTCAVSSHLIFCGGPKGVQPFEGEDFTSQTGWLAVVLHGGPLELVKCVADTCSTGDGQSDAAPEDNDRAKLL
ncbi:hypothetical protein [Budvicia diplopodorum]|uniref:hypothetical protein n=1 Tax=Budvicia diplopodorum TaxID=1119056 RepID=UPI00135A1224|nr:hypothetical protein [Budvicia diplopodorum]